MNRSASRRAFFTSACMFVVAGLARGSQASSTRLIPMVARKWTFVPSSVQVRKGEKIVFQLTAPEVPMGFSLPDFKVRTDVVPGQTATVELVPDKVGSFTFLCDIFCGEGHETMNGTLVVTG